MLAPVFLISLCPPRYTRVKIHLFLDFSDTTMDNGENLRLEDVSLSMSKSTSTADMAHSYPSRPIEGEVQFDFDAYSCHLLSSTIQLFDYLQSSIVEIKMLFWPETKHILRSWGNQKRE